MLEWKVLLTVFVTVFVAELGDKTQLATLLFAADGQVNKWVVFAGASLALVATSAIGVAMGAMLANLINPRTLGLLAGVGFMVIGLWTLIKAW